MAQWAVVIPEQRYEAERLFHHDTLEIDPPAVRPAPAIGDEVLVIAPGAVPAVVALGRVITAAGEHGGDAVRAAGEGGGSGARAAGEDGGNGHPPARLTVAYTRRSFDQPLPAGGLALAASVSPIDPAEFRALAERVAPSRDTRTWLVSVDLPIEAESPAEAVRLFWSYVRDLGPRELPAFVSPTGDELAMQAFVLGEQANLDPEEDDD
jgi:hypothetical protein